MPCLKRALPALKIKCQSNAIKQQRSVWLNHNGAVGYGSEGWTEDGHD